jgi:Raf kinase inhibitor-like YbhB/YbcL family protein
MQAKTESTERPSLRVESKDFAMSAAIPPQFTGDGDDYAPSLSWSAGPEGTQGYAILVEDPDAPNPEAPTTTFAHWILTGLRADVTSTPGGHLIPEGAVSGTNDFGNRGWNGPRPQVGRHRYFFKVFALDVKIDAPGITRPELLGTMRGHILAQGELIGTYESPREHRSEALGGERRPSSHTRHIR